MSVNLLIVDDESEILEMLSRHFRLLGYQVDTAENGVKALSLLASKRIDIMITDILMPEMSGSELLERVNQEYPMMKTIVITGYVNLENALAVMRNGADTIIFKPLEEMNELEEAVRDAERFIQNWKVKLRQLRGLKPGK